MPTSIIFADKTRASVILTPMEYLPGDHPIQLIFLQQPSPDVLESFSKAKSAAYHILLKKGWIRTGSHYAFFCEVKGDEDNGLINNIVGRSCELPAALALIIRILEDAGEDPARFLKIAPENLSVAATGIISDMAGGTVRAVESIVSKLHGTVETDPLPAGSTVFFPSDNENEVPETLLRKAETGEISLRPVSALEDCLTDTPVICPYRGLFAFGEEDAPFFFGRENFTEELLKAVHRTPLTTVVGASGSGKSSVVFAGLVPRLREERIWRILSFRPRAHPLLRTLRRACLRSGTGSQQNRSTGRVGKTGRKPPAKGYFAGRNYRADSP